MESQLLFTSPRRPSQLRTNQLLFASPHHSSHSSTNQPPFTSHCSPLQSTTDLLSQTQSLVVLKIFVHAALACICHTRELIPRYSPSFRTRYVDDLHSDAWRGADDGYSRFCDTEPSEVSSTSQEFRILTRGADRRADKILDLIETGVFPAVDGGLLESVRFFVTEGSTERLPQDLLETYNLNFSYEQDNLDSHRLRSGSFNSTQIFTTDNTIKSFKNALRSLLKSLHGLPSLPRKRSLGVAMLYNDRSSSTHEIPGFLTEEVSLAAGEQTRWQKVLLQETPRVGKFEVGKYRVAIRTNNTGVPSSARVRDLKTRIQIQSWQKSSSQQENDGLPSTLEV